MIALAPTPAKALHLGVEVRPGDYDDRAQLTESLRSILDEADVRRFACVVATRRPALHGLPDIWIRQPAPPASRISGQRGPASRARRWKSSSSRRTLPTEGAGTA